MKGTGAERDNGARGRCTGAQVQEGTGQSAITVHGRAREGAGDRGSERLRCTGTVHGRTGAERDNGARGRCTGARCRGPGQSAITVHGDGVRVKGTGSERDNGARGRCTGARE